MNVTGGAIKTRQVDLLMDTWHNLANVNWDDSQEIMWIESWLSHTYSRPTEISELRCPLILPLFVFRGSDLSMMQSGPKSAFYVCTGFFQAQVKHRSLYSLKYQLWRSERATVGDEEGRLHFHAHGLFGSEVQNSIYCGQCTF